MTNNTDTAFMEQALQQANIALSKGEVPIGAVVTLNDAVLAKSHNSPIEMNDPSAHAEILVLRKACQSIDNYRLLKTTLYVTLEPCAMCFAAMVQARISRLVFGASDPKQGSLGGAIDLRDFAMFNHRFEVHHGVLEDKCSTILIDFFKRRR
ncbi:MAG: tRNA adenosine(34) deaminase TadA [Chromatiales bacterium]|nr:tRNA adenosine(34) deaminase TadA [Chromatiales bacterium]